MLLNVQSLLSRNVVVCAGKVISKCSVAGPPGFVSSTAYALLLTCSMGHGRLGSVEYLRAR